MDEYCEGFTKIVFLHEVIPRVAGVKGCETLALLRTPSAVLLLTVAALGVGTAALAQTRPTSRFIHLDEVRAGMRGYGLTVFQGLRPERFEVEVLDVLRNFRPRQDLVLIRPTHPVLARANVVGGMSGSPIYLEDRLLGAYAYGWEFGSETVAGVTPIANMLSELRRPRRAPPGLIPGTQVPLPLGAPETPTPARARRASAWNRDAEAMRLARSVVSTRFGSLAPLSVPLSVTGVGPRTMQLLSEELAPFGVEPVQAGGAGTPDRPPPGTPEHFEAGGAVGVSLVSGDISGTSTGTVTYVEGPGVLGFGHPMMGLGEVALPAAISRIAWVMATVRRSVKLSEPVRFVGALTQDRQSCIVVDESVTPAIVPVQIRLRGFEGNATNPAAQRIAGGGEVAPRSEWNLRIAYHRGLFPRLFASSLGNVLETAAGDHADAAWTVRSRVHTRDRGVLEFTDFGASSEGASGMSASSLSVAEAVDRLTENPFEQVRIDRVEVEVALRWAREFAVVRHATLERTEADPGETVRLHVGLHRYGAPPETRVVPIEIPRELAGRELELELSGGVDTLPDLPEPESVSDLVRNLTSGFPEDSLIVTMRMPGQGVTIRGRSVPDLPGSVFDALRPAATTDGGEPFVNVRRVVLPLGRIVLGRDRVRLRVREVRR